MITQNHGDCNLHLLRRKEKKKGVSRFVRYLVKMHTKASRIHLEIKQKNLGFNWEFRCLTLTHGDSFPFCCLFPRSLLLKGSLSLWGHSCGQQQKMGCWGLNNKILICLALCHRYLGYSSDEGLGLDIWKYPMCFGVLPQVYMGILCSVEFLITCHHLAPSLLKDLK